MRTPHAAALHGCFARVLPRGSAAALVLVLLVGCATLAPGADPVVVRTEQALRSGDALYADTMAWWFAPGVAPTLSRDVSRVLDKVRTGYDPLYKDVQRALDTYKAVRRAVDAGQAGDTMRALTELRRATDALSALINQVLRHLPVAAQKKSGGQPMPGGA